MYEKLRQTYSKYVGQLDAQSLDLLIQTHDDLIQQKQFASKNALEPPPLIIKHESKQKPLQEIQPQEQSRSNVMVKLNSSIFSKQKSVMERV